MPFLVVGTIPVFEDWDGHHWGFDNTAGGGTLHFFLDMNPSRDTGWNLDPVAAEHHPIGANKTILQLGGQKSRTRIVEGITKSLTVKKKLDNLNRRNTVFKMIDHHGVKTDAFLVEVTHEELQDASNVVTVTVDGSVDDTSDYITNDAGTFRYKLKMIRR